MSDSIVKAKRVYNLNKTLEYHERMAKKYAAMSTAHSESARRIREQRLERDYKRMTTATNAIDQMVRNHLKVSSAVISQQAKELGIDTHEYVEYDDLVRAVVKARLVRALAEM